MSADTLTDITTISSPSLGRSGTEPETLPVASELSVERPALVIGDLHGHLDRLEALLLQEDLLEPCPTCLGFGNTPETAHTDKSCPECKGLGLRRINDDVDLIMLGDIGHFGKDGSPTGDKMTWEAVSIWADLVLWGNHDRAVFEARHAHSGLVKPDRATVSTIMRVQQDGRLLMAHARHGFLLTHAGLHTEFRNNKVEEILKTDPYEFADWVNVMSNPFSNLPDDENVIGVVDSISFTRGGPSRFGGILWRDIGEKLYPGFRQIFGHSADHKSHQVRYCWENGHTRKPESFPDGVPSPSYCIDIGGKGDCSGDNCLAGIWLPDERIVEWRG